MSEAGKGIEAPEEPADQQHAKRRVAEILGGSS